MEPLEVKIGSLLEEIISLNGVMSDEDLLPNSGVLCSVYDVENTVKDVFPTSPHYHSDRHCLRRCLRHLSRCLIQIQENTSSVDSENKNQFSVFQFSDKLRNNMITLLTKLKLPVDDDYALELAESVLNSSADLLVENEVFNHNSEHLRAILRRIILHGEEHQFQRWKTDVSKHSICLPWLKIITQRWDMFDESNLSEKECPSPHKSANEHFSFQHFTGSLMQSTRDLRSAIKTASVLFAEVNAVSDTILLWHNLVVLMIRQLSQLIDSRANHEGSVYSDREHASSVGSILDQNKESTNGLGHNMQWLHLWNEIEIYMHDLVEMTLDTIDNAMSIRSDDKVNLPSDKAGTSLGPSFLGSSENTDDSSSWKMVYTAVKLAVIASDAIELFTTSSRLKLQSAPKLSAKLWKGLASAFVTEIDLSRADKLDVSYCASVLSVAEVCLVLDIESVPSSVLLITFLRSLKFPDLLLDSEGLWEAMKHHLTKTDNANLKHGLQAAALRIQQSVFCLATTSREDVNKSDTIEKYEMLKSVIKRVIEILPSNSSSAPRTESNCADQNGDPWDDYFWRFMLHFGANGSEPMNMASS